MISTHTAGDTVATDRIQKQSKDSLTPIVGVYTYAGDESRVTIDEAMSDKLPTDEAYTPGHRW